jgi:DNA-binding NarL/FixJ family response regulator
MSTSGETAQISIVIIDDFHGVVERLRKMLVAVPDLHVVGEANSVGSAIMQVEASRPDVIIMDIQLGVSEPKTGIALINVFKRTYPNLTIVVFTNFADTRYHQLCVMNGATYFFDKAAGADAIPLALEEVARARKVLS